MRLKPPWGRGRRGERSKLGRAEVLLWVTIGVLVACYAVVLVVAQPKVGGERLTFTRFVELAENQRLDDARILDVDSFVVGTYSLDGNRHPYNTPYLKDYRERLVGILLDSRTPIVIDQQQGKRLASLAGTVLPILILTALFAYMILSFRRGSGVFAVYKKRGGRRGGRGAGKAVTFADVAGQDAAVAELAEVADCLRSPDRYASVGAAVPKGILLYGPPGCGKTLLARALAGEAGASFYALSGSEFVEVYVGTGAARVRELFRQARAHRPAIVFIDELDSVGRARSGPGPGSRGEDDHALNQILTEMDGFAPAQGVVVLAATNRPDVLDPALLRPGRFDRSVGLERPDPAARLAILRLHVTGKALDEGADLAALAERGVGLTGADLAGLLNEAALLAVRDGQATIGPTHLDAALARVLDAPERQRRLSLRARSIGRRVPTAERLTFADVAGVDLAVEELRDVGAYLADPGRFALLGARPPRGILLSGPPGCGKTLLARAVAGEANAAFFSAAATEFVEVYVGTGPARVRDLFAEARAVAPAVVLIDEIDSIGSNRGGATDGGREHESALNQVLIEMDGFEPRAGVIVIAATNRPDLLDAALVRPGRFDRHVAVTLPDREGREAILRLHARDKALDSGVDLAELARATYGFSGADLANVLNEAALLAVRRQLLRVPVALVEEAVVRAQLGLASRPTVMTDGERRVVAYHEAGHALVARSVHGASPHRVTILARGSSLGHCAVLDGIERVVETRSQLLDRLAVALGGRAAEEIVFGDPSTGAKADLVRVGELARWMVRDLGMSDTLAPLSHAGAPISEDLARSIDEEAGRVAAGARDRARAILGAARPALDRVAAALLERETLKAAEVDALAGEVPPPPPSSHQVRPARPA